MTRSPFFVGFLSLPLLATVEIMFSSLCCFTIVVLIDGPRGPPPATSGPVTRDSMSSEQKNSLAVVAKTEPAPERVAAKRTPQIDLAAPKVVQVVQTALSLGMSEVHPFIRARAKLLTDVNFFQLAAAR